MGPSSGCAKMSPVSPAAAAAKTSSTPDDNAGHQHEAAPQPECGGRRAQAQRCRTGAAGQRERRYNEGAEVFGQHLVLARIVI
jgi:hypothetical protein